MIIPAVFIFGLVVTLLLGWLMSTDGDQGVTAFWFFCGVTIVTLWTIGTISGFIDAKAELSVIDDKISYTEKINKERVDSVLPILEKYPKLEADIVKGINVQAFAVLGDVYPELKSNESYNQQAKIILDNIKKLEKLNLSKIELRKEITLANWNLFLLY